MDKSFDSETFLESLTHSAGIYKMLNERGEIIYIGKAKNLKNRVSSYFGTQAASSKQSAMLKKIAVIEVVVTHTETEALLLESQQIKQHKPRYNICLRDDKSYPRLYLSTQQDFPGIYYHRGAKKKQGSYYGPYPSSSAVKDCLKLLQKLFPVRQCEDSFYKNRSRPCLQHQIGRCTAPCVGLIDKETYVKDVEKIQLFLDGKADILIDKLIEQMEAAAAQLDFELAAVLRNQISRLRIILEKNFIQGEQTNSDFIACVVQAGLACVQVFFVRNGQRLGHKSFFPALKGEQSPAAVLRAFIPQYYLNKNIPRELLLSHACEETDLLEIMLSEQAEYKVSISSSVRGNRLKWLKLTLANAENALTVKIADKQGLQQRFESLQQQLGCVEMPKRLECFDISHTQGEQTVASCVVFNQEGALKADYRRFNIEGIIGGDDCAAIHQVVLRRFKRVKQGEFEHPDIVFIDGGLGQVNAAKKAIESLGLKDVMIVGVSKGVDRKAGMEKIILASSATQLDIMPDASALLLIQHIRDEAHRFAITAHRQRRSRAKKKSILEQVAGLGPKRRQQLLKQFGGLQGVSQASIEALCSIKGISHQLAQRIYDTFHQ